MTQEGVGQMNYAQESLQPAKCNNTGHNHVHHHRSFILGLASC